MAKRVRHGSANGKLNSFPTPEGGSAEFHINKTGSGSIGGQVVRYGTTEESVITTAATEFQMIGVVYNASWNVDVADGSEIAIVTEGEVDALLEDGTGSTAGNWVKTSDTQAGRVDATILAPSGGTIGELQEHMREAGHCEQTVVGASAAAITSITRVDTTATVTTTSPHGLATGREVTIAGANEADYNGDFTITVTDASEFTYTVSGSPTTPATGTITYTTINTLCRIHIHPN